MSGLSGGLVGQAGLKTATASTAGNAPVNGKSSVTLNAYAFWPMLFSGGGNYGGNTAVVFAGHGTTVANPDMPRLGFLGSSAGSVNWGINYRYVVP